jgi:hypothetical protein
MQLLCGVAGPAERARDIFDRLLWSSRHSNAGIELTIEEVPGLLLGYAARRFTSWFGEEPELRLFLDGEILFVDEQPTMNRGTSEAELAHVARLYCRRGAELWRHLDGNFCLIIQDGPLLRIGVDPVGTRSVYWWAREDVLAFHTHLLDLAPWFPGPLDEDAGAIGNMLASGCYPPGATAYRGIHHLRPGFHLSFEAGSARIDRHFRPVSQPREDGATPAAIAGELNVLLADSIGATWRAAERPVLPLSGGVDTRYIVAEVARQAEDRGRIRTITWGEDRGRANSDGVIAPRVAAAIGVENVWCEKTQTQLETSWQRALYLSSGEADNAIHYPDDHLLHEALVADMGTASIFRGDHYWASGLLPATRRGVLATVFIHHLSLDDGTFRRFLDGDALRDMMSGQTRVLTEMLDGLQTADPAGCYQELFYDIRFSQVMAVYNRVKHADLEVYNPLMARSVHDWAARVPYRYREHRWIFFEAMRRSFPELARLPYAAVDNLPNWEARFERDPRFARFYVDICSEPGWLERYADKAAVIDAFRAMERRATEFKPRVSAARAGERAARRLTPGAFSGWKETAKHTRPGRLLYDRIRERRLADKLPLYLKLARLATLHAFLGQIESRRNAAERRVSRR